jgi:hypothetical protein
MTPIQLIKQELKKHNTSDVISSIYQNLKAHIGTDNTVVFRSRSFISEDDVKIYLNEIIKCNYLCDFVAKKHRFTEFLEYLFDALGLSKVDYEITLEECERRNKLLSNMKQPYIFVDTNFRRKGETLISLALLNDKRYIRLNKNMYLDLSEEEMNFYVANAVKLHFKWRGGHLPVFGKITAYLYCDNKGNKASYNCLGKIIDKEIFESKVIIKLGNKTFIGDIK